MAATPSLKITKQFTYRGSTHKFTNRYHFSGGTPSGTTPWTTFADAVVLAEKQCYGPGVTIVQADGYAAGSDVPVFTKAYTTAGVISMTSREIMPGDCAIMLRYLTTQRTTKNHPIYLYNWFHGALKGTGDAGDTASTGQTGNISTYAGTWETGYSDGTNTYHRAGPNGAVAQSHVVSPYVRHRDFRN